MSSISARRPILYIKKIKKCKNTNCKFMSYKISDIIDL